MRNQNKELIAQITALKDCVLALEPSAVMLNILHSRVNLDCIEDCEIELVLLGIDRLLQPAMEALNEQVERLEKLARAGGENA